MSSETVQCDILVIGNGMVGHHFVEQLREQNKALSIRVLCGEANLAYDRVHLSEFFQGKTPEDLALTSLAHYKALNIDVDLNAWVVAIDKENQIVTTKNGAQHRYKKLVLATGSYPFVPPIPGNDQPHCLVYRTIEDLRAIEASASLSKIGVVVGGGLLGLEAANALKEAGLDTHVVEFAPQLMAVQLDPAGSSLLQNKIRDLGVSVHCNKATTSIESGETSRYRMVFNDGTHLETDMILFSAGIRPSDTLAREFDIAVGERGGIVIDDHCMTSDSNIYAIGECALWQNRIFGLVAPGYTMARAAVGHILGEGGHFSGADMSTKLKLMGLEVGSIGDAHANTSGAQVYTYENQPQGIYKKIVIEPSQNKLIGAVLVGDTSDYDTLLQYALNGIELPQYPESLILPSSGESVQLGASALPDTAIVCSCHNVSKADVIDSIEAGNCSVGEVKSCTKASTGCGGCASLLKQLVDSELESRGVEVSNDICEHFAYSRQQLFHIVQVEQIKDFDTLVQKHGKGLGCDICKPTAASIFASLYNDFILEAQHVGLQDTNDTFLANMQKDGTYSVVPRIPAGEVTPDQLILIGNVAKQYSLYTKVTGGQRIDLFGARVQDLPKIWEALLEGGFETGHAYAKGLRTVKSCVGSTWCRYGVQDSVGAAIDIENRYKGVRSPHKLKMAVSGCTRECAEAQSKDIGIIATDKGYNLYVCGNGGMKPRHADLFATDLDYTTLITYIDRILAFYVQTADRLQRTSVWMDNLEGGLSYLQDVIINDSLGLNKSLEAHMQTLVDAYQCEWKSVLESPSARKRFRQFVNSEKGDDYQLFVEERGQMRPATQEEKAERIAVKELV
jgi:nitrite reductase (NADH) large subunit